MFKKILHLSVLGLTLLSASAFAGGPGVGGEHVRGVDPATKEAMHEVMASYRDRLLELEASLTALEEERQAVLAELEHVLIGSTGFFAKSAYHCQEACSRVETGVDDIRTAKNLSRMSWIDSCDQSQNGSDAFFYAHNSWANGLNVEDDVCRASPSCNVSELATAKNQARTAWLAAEDALADGCDSDMQSAAWAASDAFVEFNDAIFYCSNC